MRELQFVKTGQLSPLPARTQAFVAAPENDPFLTRSHETLHCLGEGAVYDLSQWVFSTFQPA
jgi:hypothetical protein